jgi:hypothetical protein
VHQKGFIAIAALIILALIVLGGGYYMVMKMQGTPGGPMDQESAVQVSATTSNTVPVKTAQQSVSTSTNPQASTEVGFSATPTSGAAPLTVSFSSAFTSATQTNSIDFGDGQIGSLGELKTCNGVDDCSLLYSGHEYSVPGVYTATLSNCAINQPHCSYGVVLGTVTITVVSTSSSISVPGMNEYTDSDFGFSFWYPNGWEVEQTAISNPGVYVGGTVIKEFTVGAPDKTPFDPGVVISEYSSPGATITDPLSCGAMGNCGATTRYYFDIGTHTWMVQYPDGYSGEGGSAIPGTTKAADISANTMGGLHMLSGSSGDTIVPLSAQNFLVVSNAQSQSVSVPDNQDYLVQTVVATDPSVATPESIAQQTAAIQAEQSAYAGQ